MSDGDGSSSVVPEQRSRNPKEARSETQSEKGRASARVYDRALALDPANASVALDALGAAARLGDVARARAIGEGLPATALDAATSTAPVRRERLPPHAGRAASSASAVQPTRYALRGRVSLLLSPSHAGQATVPAAVTPRARASVGMAASLVGVAELAVWRAPPRRCALWGSVAPARASQAWRCAWASVLTPSRGPQPAPGRSWRRGLALKAPGQWRWSRWAANRG